MKPSWATLQSRTQIIKGVAQWFHEADIEQAWTAHWKGRERTKPCQQCEKNSLFRRLATGFVLPLPYLWGTGLMLSAWSAWLTGVVNDDLSFVPSDRQPRNNRLIKAKARPVYEARDARSLFAVINGARERLSFFSATVECPILITQI
jgi:hypothetical protein